MTTVVLYGFFAAQFATDDAQARAVNSLFYVNLLLLLLLIVFAGLVLARLQTVIGRVSRSVRDTISSAARGPDQL